MNETTNEFSGTQTPPPFPGTSDFSRGAPPPPVAPTVVKESWTMSCFRGCLTMSFVFIIFCTLLTVWVGRSCTKMANESKIVSGGSFKEMFNNEQADLDDQDDGKKTVLELKIHGMISDGADKTSWYGDENSSQSALAQIRKATKNKNIEGLLIKINSGGGEITASDVIWNSLKQFKAADSNRVVVVMMGSMAASGAYYISAAADYIIANPTTMTGSIGVIMNSFNVQDLASKIGYKNVTIKSGANKDILSPFSDLTPAQRQLLQSMVDSLHSRFVTIVAEGRGLDESTVRALADGRVFLASEALQYKLIDKIGYIEDAKAYLEDRFGEEPVYVDPTAQPPFMKFFSSPSFWGECISQAIFTSSHQAAGEDGFTFK